MTMSSTLNFFKKCAINFVKARKSSQGNVRLNQHRFTVFQIPSESLIKREWNYKWLVLAQLLHSDLSGVFNKKSGKPFKRCRQLFFDAVFSILPPFKLQKKSLTDNFLPIFQMVYGCGGCWYSRHWGNWLLATGGLQAIKFWECQLEIG